MSPICQSESTATIDSERFKLLYGPYKSPKFKVGDMLSCEYRGRELKVRGLTDARIPWPATRRGPRASPILCGDLIRAVERESVKSHCSAPLPRGVPDTQLSIRDGIRAVWSSHELIRNIGCLRRKGQLMQELPRPERPA